MLEGLPFNGDKAGAQTLMPGNQTVQRKSQSVVIERTRQTQCGRKMIGLTGGGIELSQKPQALLGKRQRQRLTAIGCRDHRLGCFGYFTQSMSQHHQNRLGKDLV
ncbi:hypothetical protein XENE109146_17735 [Xenorhabdus nematophila]